MKLLDIPRNCWETVKSTGFPRYHAIALGALGMCLVGVLAAPSNEAATQIPSRIAAELELKSNTPLINELPDQMANAGLKQSPESSDKAKAELDAANTQGKVKDSISFIENDPLNTFTPLKFDNELITVKVAVKKGDTLANIFQRAGATHADMSKILKSSNEGKRLTKIHPKQIFEFRFDQHNKLQRMTNHLDRLVKHNFDLINDRFVFNEVAKQVDTHLTSRKATISGSLFLSAKNVGMSDKIVMELAQIFGYDIDFALEVREGDSFNVLYEEHYVEGKRIADGEILAAEFTNRGKAYHAVRYRNKKGHVAYYTPAGNSVKKEFLRTPVDFARISSHFNLRRKHPVLNKIRAHKGTDYAAATGTPIRAAGDGKVIFAGRKGGYGNTLIIKHGERYQTLYAHISKFRRGIRSGKRVQQGQIVAYVGSTGLATGPHLHYEFYVNGAVRNPVTVKLPKASSVEKEDLPHFISQTSPLLAQLAPDTGVKVQTKLASADSAIKQNDP